MGGAVGEVHGAKLVGLLRAALAAKPAAVLILFDTGGVRLQEANAGELAIAEIMRAVLDARAAGVPVLGLVGGRAGCYGGGGIISACCSGLVVSEQGRISVSGPEVIETNKGVEEFDSKDRALVWRTMGGKHRRLLGVADAFADDAVTVSAPPRWPCSSRRPASTWTRCGRSRRGWSCGWSGSAAAPTRATSGRRSASPSEGRAGTRRDEFVAVANGTREATHGAR